MEHIIPERFIRMCKLLEITSFPVHWKFEEKDQQIVVTFIWNIGSSDVFSPVQATPKVESTDSEKDHKIQKPCPASDSKQPTSHHSVLKSETPTNEASSTDQRRSKSRSSSRTTSPAASPEDRKSITGKHKEKSADNKDRLTDTRCEKTHSTSSSKYGNFSNDAKVCLEKANGSKSSDGRKPHQESSTKHRHPSSNSEKKLKVSSSKDASCEKAKSSVRSSGDSKHRHSSSKSNSSSSSSKTQSKSSNKTAKPEIVSDVQVNIQTDKGTYSCGHTTISKPSNKSLLCVTSEVKHTDSRHKESKESSSRKDHKSKESNSQNDNSHKRTRVPDEKKYRESSSLDVKGHVKPSSREREKRTEPSSRHVKQTHNSQSRSGKTNKDPRCEKSKKDSSSRPKETQESANEPREKHSDAHSREQHGDAILGCEPMRDESLSEPTHTEPSSQSVEGSLCTQISKDSISRCEQTVIRSNERCEHKPKDSITQSEQTPKGSQCDTVPQIDVTSSGQMSKESRGIHNPKRSSSSSSREKITKEPSSRCKQSSKGSSSICEPKVSDCDQTVEKSTSVREPNDPPRESNSQCEQTRQESNVRSEETVEQLQCELTLKPLDMPSGELTATKSKTSRELTSKDSKSRHQKTSKENISERNRHSKSLNSKTKNAAEKMHSSGDRNKHPMTCSVKTHSTSSQDKTADSPSSGLPRGKRRHACTQDEQLKKLKMDTDINQLGQSQEVKPLDQSMEVTNSEKLPDSVDPTYEVSQGEPSIGIPPEISQRPDTNETSTEILQIPEIKDSIGSTSEASPKQSSIPTPLSIAQKPSTKDSTGPTIEVSSEESKIRTPLSIAQKPNTKDSSVPNAPRRSTTVFPKNNLWDMFINRCMVKTDVTFSDLPVKESTVQHKTVDPDAKIDSPKDVQTNPKDDKNLKIKQSTERNDKQTGTPAKDRKEDRSKPVRKSTTHSRLNTSRSTSHQVKHTLKTKTAESKISSKTSTEKIPAAKKTSKKSSEKNLSPRSSDDEKPKALPVTDETPTEQDPLSNECSINIESVFESKYLSLSKPIDAAVTDSVENTGDRHKVFPAVTYAFEDTGEHPKELHYDPVDSDEDDSFSELMIDLEHHDPKSNTNEDQADSRSHPCVTPTVQESNSDSSIELMIDLEHDTSKSDTNEEEKLLIDQKGSKLHPSVTPTVQESNSYDNIELMIDLEHDTSKGDTSKEEMVLIEQEDSQLHPSVTPMDIQESNSDRNKNPSHAISPSKPKDFNSHIDVLPGADKDYPVHTCTVDVKETTSMDIVTPEEQIDTTEETQVPASSDQKISLEIEIPQNLPLEEGNRNNNNIIPPETEEINADKIEKNEIPSNQQEVEETAISKKEIDSSNQKKTEIDSSKFEEISDNNVGDEDGIHNDELEEGNCNNNSKNELHERDVYNVIGGEIIKDDQKKEEIFDNQSLERGVCNVEEGEIITYQNSGEILESDLEDGEIEDDEDEADEFDTSASIEHDEGTTVITGKMVFDNVFVACSPVSSFEPQTDEEPLDLLHCNGPSDDASRHPTSPHAPCQIGSRTGSMATSSPTEDIETPLSIYSVQTEDVDKASRASTPLLDEINEPELPDEPGFRTVILPKSEGFKKQCPQVKSQVSIPDRKKRRKTKKSKNQSSEPDLVDTFQLEKLSKRQGKRLRRHLRKQRSELPDSTHDEMKEKIKKEDKRQKKEEKRPRKTNQAADLWTQSRAKGTQEHTTHKKQHVTDWDKLLQKHIHEMKRPKSNDAKTEDLNKKIDSFLIEIDLKNNKNYPGSFLPSNQAYIETTKVQRPGKVHKQVNFGNLIDVQSYTSARGEASFDEREQFDHDSLMDSIIISSTYQEKNQENASKKRRRHTADSDSESEDEDHDPRKFQRTTSRSLPKMNRDIAIQQRNNPDTGLHQYLFLYEDSRPCAWIDSDEIKENNPHFYNSLKKCFVPKEGSQEQSELQQKLYNLVGLPS